VSPFELGDAFATGGLLGERSVSAMMSLVGPAGTWLVVLGGVLAVSPVVAGVDLQVLFDRGFSGIETMGPPMSAWARSAANRVIERFASLKGTVSTRWSGWSSEVFGRDQVEEPDEVDSIPPSQPFVSNPPQKPDLFSRPFDERVLDTDEKTQIGQRELVEVEWTTSGTVSSNLGDQDEVAMPTGGGADQSLDRRVEPMISFGEVEVEEPPVAIERSRTPDAPQGKPDPGEMDGADRIEVAQEGLVSGGEARDGLAVVSHNNFEDFELPHLGLLDTHERDVARFDESELQQLAETLETKLADFGVRGEVTAIRPGPVITTFEYLPAAGIRVSKISGLADDVAMALKALRVRIVAPIPGKGVVGIEIPNRSRQMIWVRDLLANAAFRNSKAVLPMALGKTVEGRPRIADLSRMPHLLVGGTTGSGKSVGVNAVLLSMLFTNTPRDLRLILIDPKMLEFELYQDIPHLLHPVVTDPRLASAALKWACTEMDDRYRMLARWKTRNIASFNDKLESERNSWTKAKSIRYGCQDEMDAGVASPPEKMPYIVIVIDELADLMMVAAKDVEESIIRLAQKARACGIHLIVATQRPSVNVITGLIKANMPSRIAFQIRTKVDSRTILDQNGAENLLGKGDMLFLPPGVSALERCHGAFVSDEEVRNVTDFLREQASPVYEAEIQADVETGNGSGEQEYDDLYDLAVAHICREAKASTSMIQREFKIGYNRAARMIEVMEREGVVGPADGARPRQVLVNTH